MSNVSNHHTVGIHTDSSKALSDQRLSVVTFKTPKDKKDDQTYKKPVARSVSIPVLKVEIIPPILQAALQQAFHDLQDDVVRKLVVEKLESEPNVVSFDISDDAISFDAVAAYAASEAVSGKLSKELLENWFDENLDEPLTLALAAAMKLSDTPTDAETARLDAAVKQHRVIISQLASPRAALPEKIVLQLQKAVALAPTDKVRNSLDEKLKGFLQPREVTLELGL